MVRLFAIKLENNILQSKKNVIQMGEASDCVKVVYTQQKKMLKSDSKTVYKAKAVLGAG